MMEFEELKILAERRIRATLKSLPEELQRVAGIPVLLEKIPAKGDRKMGIDCNVLGLFIGPTLTEIRSGSGSVAPHILLFLENIWQESGEDLETFGEEIEITLLHELGHYLDWNEDDLAERGLG